MFEKETEQLISIVRRTTIADAKTISLRAMYESKIPSSIKIFFCAEVESMLEAERPTGPRSTKFNYDIPELQTLREQIDSLLVHNFVFSKADFETTLDTCVHFLFNYLCRPQWTLNSFLLGESGAVVTAQQLLKKLRYCRDHAYFSDILRRYVQQRNITAMTPAEGRSLLEKIDTEVVKNHSSIELAQMTQPLFDFIAYARSHELHPTTRTVPTRALMYFFEDKKMQSIHDRLLHERDVHNVKEMSFSQLANLLEKIRTGNEHALVVEEDAEPLPLYDEVSLETATPQYLEEETTPPIAEPRKPLPPLFSLEEERLIIKYVFHQNEDQFRAAVNESLAAQTWDDAAQTIDHFFLMNDVEPFTKEAILFTNKLQSRFNEQTQSKTS